MSQYDFLVVLRSFSRNFCIFFCWFQFHLSRKYRATLTMLVDKFEKGVFVTTKIVFTAIMLQNFWYEFLINKCFVITSNYFWFLFLKRILNSVTANKWKLDTTVSKTVLYWKNWFYLLVLCRYIRVCWDFWNMLAHLPKLFKPLKLQKHFREVSPIESTIKRKLS